METINSFIDRQESQSTKKTLTLSILTERSHFQLKIGNGVTGYSFLHQILFSEKSEWVQSQLQIGKKFERGIEEK